MNNEIKIGTFCVPFGGAKRTLFGTPSTSPDVCPDKTSNPNRYGAGTDVPIDVPIVPKHNLTPLPLS